VKHVKNIKVIRNLPSKSAIDVLCKKVKLLSYEIVNSFMKNPFGRKISRAFLYSIVALLICSAISLITLNRAAQKESWVQHTHLVIQRLELLLSVLKDAETGVRGYVITKQTYTLEPYNHAEKDIHYISNNVRALTQDNLLQQNAITLLDKNISRQFGILKEFINITSNGQSVKPAQIEKGKQVMDEARKLVSLMENREYRLLKERNEEWHGAWGYIPFLIGLLTLASVISTSYFCRNLQVNYFEKVKFRRLLQQKSIITRNRIHIIQSVTAQVAGGNYAVRISGQERDILGSLSDDINQMTSSLDHSFRSLQAWMQKKDEFIDITAHEFRTPLTSIKAALQFIGRLKPSGKKVLPFIEKANNQVKRLTGILKDLVDVSKINNGNLQLYPVTFSITGVVAECIEEIKVGYVGAAFEVTGQTAVNVYADRLKVAQVMINLLSNAVKYSHGQAPVEVNISSVDEWVKIAVTDRGRGIPPDKLLHVFDRYFRVEETSQNYSGMGLGLYIAKGIVKQHGGEIGADSTVNLGTTVWFTLPASLRG
jgi:signal transduction histidine kinase